MTSWIFGCVQCVPHCSSFKFQKVRLTTCSNWKPKWKKRVTSSRPPDEAFSVPFSGVCPGIFWNCALQAEIQVSNVSRQGFLESCQSPQFSQINLYISKSTHLWDTVYYENWPIWQMVQSANQHTLMTWSKGAKFCLWQISWRKRCQV